MHLLGSQPEPAHSFGLVLEDAGSVDPEVELGIGVTLLGGQPEPAHRFGIVLENALAVGVHLTEAALRKGETLIRSEPVPAPGFGIVLENALAEGVHVTEAELRPCVQLRGRLRRGTLFGGHQEEFQNLELLVCEYGSDGCISPSREQSLKLLFCQDDLFGIVLCQEYSDGQQHRHDHGGGHVDRSVCFVCRPHGRRRSFFLGGRQVYHHPKSTQSLLGCNTIERYQMRYKITD